MIKKQELELSKVGCNREGYIYHKKLSGPAPLVAELLRFPNGVHDDQVDALAWVGLMMTEYATFYEAPEHVPSWRDRLNLIAKGPKKKSAMSA